MEDCSVQGARCELRGAMQEAYLHSGGKERSSELLERHSTEVKRVIPLRQRASSTNRVRVGHCNERGPGKRQEHCLTPEIPCVCTLHTWPLGPAAFRKLQRLIV